MEKILKSLNVSDYRMIGRRTEVMRVSTGYTITILTNDGDELVFTRDDIPSTLHFLMSVKGGL